MRRIAIVEDEPAIRANYADALRRHGYEVAAYANRADALAAFRTRLPDLALVDIGLSDDVDGGFALVRELRALSATVPIIFLSARDSDFDIVAGLRLGAAIGLINTVVAELYTAVRGLGGLLSVYGNTFQMAPYFVVVFVLAIIGTLVSQGLRIIEGRMDRWRYSAG